jgi:hypothetical protein
VVAQKYRIHYGWQKKGKPMKYSASANFPTKASSIANGIKSATYPLSRIKGLERKNRILSVACYFGLAPLLWSSGVTRQQNRLLNHHLRYSQAFSFIVLCVLIFDLLTDAIQYWMTTILWNPTMAEYRASVIPMWVICELTVFGSILTVSIFGISWLVAVVGAWRGRMPHIPLISSVASSYQAVKFGMYWSLLVEFVLVLLIGLGIHSVQIADSLTEKGDVYILYTQGGYIPINGIFEAYTPPRWAVTMAFYPLVQAGLEKYGDQGVSVLPLSEDSFNEAVHNGRFIFVASHGGFSSGAFTIANQPYKEYKPADVAQSLVGEQLQSVYFAGCWTGDLESEWRQTLGLDDATMFNRLSFVEEHLLWVWFKAPEMIRGLK